MPLPPPWPCLTAGDPSAPPLVLLHGFMGSAQDWSGALPALSVEFFCIAPDLPGHGKGPAAWPEMGFKALSGDLGRLLDAFGLSQASVLGYSMGGRLALFAATVMPERFAALILEGSSPGIEDPAARRERRALDRRRADRMRAEGMARFLEGWYDMPLFASLRARPEIFDPMLSRRLVADPSQLAIAIEALSPGRQPHVWSGLQSLTMPTMFIAGQLDGRYGPLSTQIASLVPDAEAVLIPDAGHNVHLEATDAFVEAVRGFLRAKVTA